MKNYKYENDENGDDDEASVYYRYVQWLFKLILFVYCWKLNLLIYLLLF